MIDVSSVFVHILLKPCSNFYLDLRKGKPHCSISIACLLLILSAPASARIFVKLELAKSIIHNYHISSIGVNLIEDVSAILRERKKHI